MEGHETPAAEAGTTPGAVADRAESAAPESAAPESAASERPGASGTVRPAIPDPAALPGKVHPPAAGRARSPAKDQPAGPPAKDQPAGPPAKDQPADASAKDQPAGFPVRAEAPGSPAKAHPVDAPERPVESAEPAPAAPPATAVAAGRGGVAQLLRLAEAKGVAQGAGRLARSAGRGTADWSRRPAGRLIVPAIVTVLLLAVAGTAGAYLVPQSLRARPASTASSAPAPGAAASLPATPGGVAAPTLSAGAGLPTTSGYPFPQGAGTRPADALAGWAQQVGTRVGIPVVAVEAYGYAELVLRRTAPACHLSWTTIAALGEVESAHGSANGAVLGADGIVQPPIYGLPLDGRGGRQLIRDTDQGTIDGDPTYDRAVGPLQFIPSTWRENAIDADNNGVADPNDIDDAALTAASYLCKNGRDLSRPDGWWAAILSYNVVSPYAQRVYEVANEYGKRSRG